MARYDLRCTDEEKARWEAAAAWRGKRLADWMRDELDNAAEESKEREPPPPWSGRSDPGPAPAKVVRAAGPVGRPSGLTTGVQPGSVKFQSLGRHPLCRRCVRMGPSVTCEECGGGMKKIKEPDDAGREGVGGDSGVDSADVPGISGQEAKGVGGQAVGSGADDETAG